MRTAVAYNTKTAISAVIPALIDAEKHKLVCRGLYIYSPIHTTCLFCFTTSQLPRY